MRVFYLSLILVFTAVLANAQKYVPFPMGEVTWKTCVSRFENNHTSYRSHIYNQKGDTVINGISYRLLSNRSEKPFGALREDSSRRIYIYYFSEADEKLLYDFNLALHDSLPETQISVKTNYVVSIDSVEISGHYHKRYGIGEYKNDAHAFVYLIEGIGSTFGLLERLMHPFEEDKDLDAVEINGVLFYGDNKCGSSSVYEFNEQTNQFSIYPNPTTGKFTVQTQRIFSDSYICVRDVLGRIVFQEKLQFASQSINISNQPKGLYFVELYYSSKKSVQKIIIQ